MIFELAKVIFTALSFGFTAVQKVFDSLGFPWVSAVCMMVLVSVVLRLFTARFIGSAIRSGIDSGKRERNKAEKKNSASDK